MGQSDSSPPLKASDITGPIDVTYSSIPKIRKDKLLLSGDGIFPTLQGEGPTVGHPCVFIRLHHCNLKCSYCDAWYTWKQESKEFWTEGNYEDLESVASILNQVWEESFPPDIERRVIWTGGEPLMHRTQIDNVMLMLWREWNSPFWHPEVETNGTLMPTELQLSNFQFNCSPKLSNSDNKLHQAVKPKILKVLNQDAVNSTFKFVCRNEADLDEVQSVFGKYVNHEKIIIMAEGVTSDEIDQNLKALYKPCMNRGLRLQGRLQAQFAHGAERGV